MARKPRIDCPEVLYHVLARGNQRQAIFRDEEDYRAYLERLLHYQQRYRFYLYAYVLMPNHRRQGVRPGRVVLPSRIVREKPEKTLCFGYS